jgi:hypothetical protein
MKKSILAAIALTLAGPALSAAPPELEVAVAKWAAPKSIPRYQYSLIDLNGDGKLDAIAFISDQNYCGNGGCWMVVLRGTSQGYEVVSATTLAQRPIFVLKEVQFGWHSLAVTLGGFGREPGLALLRFDGKEYPSNAKLQNRIQLSAGMSLGALDFLEGQ